MSAKPDWKGAPSWANFMARDEDGEWRVFENEPQLDVSRGIWTPNNGRHEPFVHWTETRESRT